MKPRPAPPVFASDLAPAYAGLELLSTAVLVIDANGRVRWVNQSAESMLDLSRRIVQGQLARGLFMQPGAIDHLLDEASVGAFSMRRQVMLLRRPLREPLQVQAVATALYMDETPLLLELSPIEQQLKLSREERRSCCKPSCGRPSNANTPASSSPRPTGCKPWSTGCSRRTGLPG